MDTIELAGKVEAHLHTLLKGTGGNSNPYALEGAHLYGVALGDGDGEIAITLIDTHPDVYDLLDSTENALVASGFAYTLVVTTGWASPLNENGEVEGRPSEHAQRRRVRLSIVANYESVASVLRFADDPDNVVTDAGEATGSLNDAIRNFVATGTQDR